MKLLVLIFIFIYGTCYLVCNGLQIDINNSRLPLSRTARSRHVQHRLLAEVYDEDGFDNPTSQPTSIPTAVPSLDKQYLPSSQPTSAPTSSIPSGNPDPTSQPTTVPTGAPTSELPSSQPTSLPSANPSIDLNALPTSQPTSVPSAMPTNKHEELSPTSQPTSVPSAMPTHKQEEIVPTSQPTSQPTIDPTMQPTYEPSTQPSASPSSHPTLAPSYDQSPEPTNQPSAQPSSFPSSQSTSLPTWQPSSIPTEQPTGQPSSQPTTQPSSSPSVQPSSFPSAPPTSMPSPQGSLNVRWWYFVTARCELQATSFASYAHQDVLDAVVYAFSFVLTDTLNEVEREDVVVAAVPIEDTAHSQRALRLSSPHLPYPHTTNSALMLSGDALVEQERGMGVRGTASSEYEYAAYRIEAWCPDHATALKVVLALQHIQVDHEEIIEPIHERGLYDVDNVTISEIQLGTTTVPPPWQTDNLSPVRITWIILGTLLFFGLGVLVISRMRYIKHLACSKTCIEDTCRTWYYGCADACMWCLRSVGLVSSDLRLYYGSGFDLTTQDEEADFYGENNGNLPSDNLDIHYGGDIKNLRSKYLDDDEDSLGGSGSGRGLFGKSKERSGSRRLLSGPGRSMGPPGSIEMQRYSPCTATSSSNNLNSNNNQNVYFNPINNNNQREHSNLSPDRLVHSAMPRSYNPIVTRDAYASVSDRIDDIGDFTSPSPEIALVEKPIDDSYESFVV